MNVVLPNILAVLIFVAMIMAVPFLFAVIGYCFYNRPLRMSLWCHTTDEYRRACFLLTSF